MNTNSRHALAFGSVLAIAVGLLANQPSAAASPIPTTTAQVQECQKPCWDTYQACLHICFDGHPYAPGARACGQTCNDTWVACNKACIAKWGLDP